MGDERKDKTGFAGKPLADWSDRFSNLPPESAGVETVLGRGGRAPEAQYGFVNPPVAHGSTVVFPDLAALNDPSFPYRYGLRGNPNSDGVRAIVNRLESAAGTALAPSGLSALTLALLSVLSAGDEVLITDSAYDPTRHLATDLLARFGIGCRFYDPRIGAGIADILAPNTRAILIESPGSLTFEIQDLPAIVSATAGRRVKLIVDNSWASPLYHQPLTLGADLVVHAATKLFIGHSDALFGTVSANADTWPLVRRTQNLMGVFPGPDDTALAARGLRTLAIRLKAHEERALALASWLEGQAGVKQVLHPALASHPDHAIFKRDFSGSGSVFSVILDPRPRAAMAALVDNLDYFAIGYSWGGYASLALPADPRADRTAVPWTEDGALLRLHVGFEDIEDLKADIAAGLARYLAIG